MAPNSCINECPSDFYIDNAGSCQRCHSTCGTCTGPLEDNCNSCSASRYMTLENKCAACTTGCDECSSATFCTKCSPNLYLYSGDCLENCPETTYKDNTSGKCEACITGCSDCTDGTTCTTCSQGYYKSGTTCTKCSANCKSCDATGCLKCEDSFFMTSTKTCT